MNTRTSFALILTLLPSVLLGCVFPLALGHSKVVVEGHLIGWFILAGVSRKLQRSPQETRV